ncbi:hypothetical protein J4404_00440 [Candidatus Woesearchaeota archaeon]|nr:hypothetical protein [Candidatus Woesearchaeota archaeon]
METPENPMYVYIEDPVSFRKEILKNAIEVTTTLKHFEEFKVTRDRKTKKLQELRNLLLDAKKKQRELLKDLPALPEEKTKEVPEKKEVIEKVVKKEVEIEPPKIVVSKEEDKLLKELNDIQRKLKEL